MTGWWRPPVRREPVVNPVRTTAESCQGWRSVIMPDGTVSYLDDHGRRQLDQNGELRPEHSFDHAARVAVENARRAVGIRPFRRWRVFDGIRRSRS